MSEFDYERFLQESFKKGVTADEFADESKVYEEVYKAKIALRNTRKNKLDYLEGVVEDLETEYLLRYMNSRELYREKISVNTVNSKFYAEILNAVNERQDAIVKYTEMMEDLDKTYSVFTKVESNPETLKMKIIDLKSAKHSLQEQFNETSEELKNVLKSMREWNIPIPNLDEMKEVEKEVLEKCGGITAKEQMFSKLKHFIEEYKTKIN